MVDFEKVSINLCILAHGIFSFLRFLMEGI